MSDDPLRIFTPGFSGDGSDSEARSLIDAWRDEWHLEPEPELDGANSQVYESLVGHVDAALARARKEGAQAQLQASAKTTCVHCGRGTNDTE